MALQISYEDATGATHAESYTRVLKVTINRQTSEARADVGVYHDAAARSAEKECVKHLSLTFTGSKYTDMFGETNLDTAGENPTKAVYDELKTLAEWSSATDV